MRRVRARAGNGAVFFSVSDPIDNIGHSIVELLNLSLDTGHSVVEFRNFF